MHLHLLKLEIYTHCPSHSSRMMGNICSLSAKNCNKPKRTTKKLRSWYSLFIGMVSNSFLQIFNLKEQDDILLIVSLEIMSSVLSLNCDVSKHSNTFTYGNFKTFAILLNLLHFDFHNFNASNVCQQSIQLH